MRWPCRSIVGSQTDKASMLDEIIDYVKFLQLQVKVRKCLWTELCVFLLLVTYDLWR